MLAKQIPKLLALTATVRGVRTEVSPEVVWEGVGTRFSHPRDVLMRSGSSQTNPTSCATPTQPFVQSIYLHGNTSASAIYPYGA